MSSIPSVGVQRNAWATPPEVVLVPTTWPALLSPVGALVVPPRVPRSRSPERRVEECVRLPAGRRVGAADLAGVVDLDHAGDARVDRDVEVLHPGSRRPQEVVRRRVAGDLARSDDLAGRVDVDRLAVRAAERAEVLHDARVPDHGMPVDPARAVAGDLSGVVDRDRTRVELRIASREDREGDHRAAGRNESPISDDLAGLRRPDDGSGVVDVRAPLGVAATRQLDWARARAPPVRLEVQEAAHEPDHGARHLTRRVEASGIANGLQLGDGRKNRRGGRPGEGAGRPGRRQTARGGVREGVNAAGSAQEKGERGAAMQGGTGRRTSETHGQTGRVNRSARTDRGIGQRRAGTDRQTPHRSRITSESVFRARRGAPGGGSAPALRGVRGHVRLGEHHLQRARLARRPRNAADAERHAHTRDPGSALRSACHFETRRIMISIVSGGASGAKIANSSPPIRATMSAERKLCVRIQAASRSASSPTRWPCASLIALSPSRSAKKTRNDLVRPLGDAGDRLGGREEAAPIVQSRQLVAGREAHQVLLRRCRSIE